MRGSLLFLAVLARTRLLDFLDDEAHRASGAPSSGSHAIEYDSMTSQVIASDRRCRAAVPPGRRTCPCSLGRKIAAPPAPLALLAQEPGPRGTRRGMGIARGGGEAGVP